MRRRPSDYVDVRDECPYCGFRFTIEVSSVLGELHAIRCLDCRETFVVAISVAVTHKIRVLAGVNPDDVLDRLVAGAHPGKAESDGPADPISRITPGDLGLEAVLVEDDPVLGTAREEFSFSIGERPDDAAPGIPVLTDVVLGDRELEETPSTGISESVLGEISELEAARVNEPKRELTAAEIDELRDLLRADEPGPEIEDPEFEPVPFRWCDECKTRHFCNNRQRCTREDPARAHSGITTRRHSPSLAGLARSAPASVSNDGLKYGDRG